MLHILECRFFMKANKKSQKNVKSTAHSNQSSKEEILSAAIELFARRGYAETTIQDIVKKAKINLSMVSYYFGGKEALFIACLNRSAEQGIQDIERVLLPPRSKEEFIIRLNLFVDDFFSSHIKKKYETTLIRREFTNPSKLARALVNKTIPHFFETIEGFFKSAQKIEIIKKDIDTKLLTLLFLSPLLTFTGEPELVKIVSPEGIIPSSFRNLVSEKIILMLDPFLNE